MPRTPDRATAASDGADGLFGDRDAGASPARPVPPGCGLFGRRGDATPEDSEGAARRAWRRHLRRLA